MRVRRLLCLILFGVVARGLGAAEGQSGSLQIRAIPTIQYAHQDIWTKTPTESGPHFAAVAKVVRRQPVHILVSASQFARDANGQSEVNYRVKFIRPDGSAGNGTDELKLIPRGKGGDPRYIHMAPALAVFTAEQTDPAGDWQIVVEATDAISGATVRQEHPLTVCPDELLQEPLPSETSLGHWLVNYHHRPAPQQLLAALRGVAEQPPAKNRPRRYEENGVWLGCFEQVLSDNPWLLPHLVGHLDQAQGRERELLAISLAYAKRDELSFFQTLPDKAREAFMPHRRLSWPVPDAEPLTGTQLDVLWGRFFASSRYAPIRELVAVLAYYPYQPALEKFRQQENKPARPPLEVQKSIVFAAAVWSLRSNIQHDKVVRDYCEGILLRKELPEAEHRWLAGIFQAPAKSPPTDNPSPKSGG